MGRFVIVAALVSALLPASTSARAPYMPKWKAVGVAEAAGLSLADQYIGGFSTWRVTSCHRKSRSSFVCRVHAWLTDDPEAQPNPYSDCRQTVDIRWVRQDTAYGSRLIAAGYGRRPACG